MSDLHAREASAAEWDGPVVELVEDDRVVGIVYVHDEVLYTELSADADGEPWAFEVPDLQRTLDTAAAMLLPDTSLVSAVPGAAEGDEHPVDVLAEEFDDTAVHRGDEDEGFYPPRIAARIIQRAEVLGLAVVSMEGCRIEGGAVVPVPGLAVDIGEAHDGEPWPMFLAGSNVQAMALVERWNRERDVVLSIEVGDDDGERYLL